MRYALQTTMMLSGHHGLQQGMEGLYMGEYPQSGQNIAAVVVNKRGRNQQVEKV